jgi:hypothetical protein
MNGKPNRVITFSGFEEMHWASEPEVIELVEARQRDPVFVSTCPVR